VPSLEQYEKQPNAWSLEELAATANELLPTFLPAAEDRPQGAGKVRQEVNPRLIRHYAGLGLIDEAGRDGREARYGYRHLLQLLLTRRLLAEGYPAGVIQKMIAAKADDDLRALLRGGASLSAQPANPALDYLEQIRRRPLNGPPAASSPSAAPVNGAAMPPPLPAAVPPPLESVLPAWARVEVLPGLELHVREDFQFPATPYERDNLQRYFLDALKTIARQPRRKNVK
jgi:DNA-binding transcriptional MerR regulator